MNLINCLIVVILASVQSCPPNYVTYRDLWHNKLQLPKSPYIIRDEWNASKPKRFLDDSRENVTEIRVRYASSQNCFRKTECITIVKQLQKKFMDRRFPDIVYHFLIDPLGNVYEGLGWYRMQPKKMKHKHIRSIGIIGSKDNELTPKQIRSITELIQDGMNRNILNEDYNLSAQEPNLVISLEEVKQAKITKVICEEVSPKITYDNFIVTTEFDY